MKIATYKVSGKTGVGVISKDLKSIYPIEVFGYDFTDMRQAIENLTDDDIHRINQKVEEGTVGESMSLSNVELLAPIPRPSQDVVCLGINYREHAKESAEFTKIKYEEKRDHAIYFSKRVTEAVSPMGGIEGHFDIVKDLDYEVELAVVVRKDGRDIKKTESKDYVFGYMVINDVSARTLQSQHKQWYRGKSLDGFTPMGPWIVTVDEFECYPPKLKIESKVNGELRQSSNTANMIFNVDEIIEEFSAGLTLTSGTIIATGTPSGVAMGMKEPKYLKEGDIVECTIEGIGTIRNFVK